MTIHLLLMILAVICLLLTAFGVASHRVNLLALGLALWATATIVTV